MFRRAAAAAAAPDGRRLFRQVPLYAAICRYMPLYVAICRYMSLYVAISRYIPLYPAISHYIPLYPGKDHYGAVPVPPGRGPSCMKALSTLAVTRDALLSQPLMGSAWPQAMELADHTAPSRAVVK